MKHALLIAPIALFAASLASADVTEEKHFSYTLETGGRISLENVNGDITITGGSGDTVEITALKKAGSQEYLDGIKINITADADRIRVETKLPESSGWFNWGGDHTGSVTYTLSVPASANLDTIESVNGEIRLSGVLGTVRAETVNGGIDASDLSGNVKLETVNGGIDGTFAGLSGTQKVDCETVNGKINLRLPANAGAHVSAETVNGGIDAGDFGLEANKGFVGRDLEGDIGDGSARVSLNTVNGAIRLRKD